MIHSSVDLGTITIPNGGTDSDAMDFRKWRSAAHAITIIAPATLTGSVVVQVSEDNSTWENLQSSGADISIPAGDAVVVKSVGFKYLRMHSGSAEGGARAFIIKGEEGL